MANLGYGVAHMPRIRGTPWGSYQPRPQLHHRPTNSYPRLKYKTAIDFATLDNDINRLKQHYSLGQRASALVIII